MNKKKLKFKKLLNEYRSEFYELQYVIEVLRDANQEFEVYYRQYCKDKDIDLEKLNREHAPRVSDVFSGQQGIVKAIEDQKPNAEFDSKKLFRQIARKFHPDTVDEEDPRKSEYEDAFKRASSAIDEGNWGQLFDIADQYNLDLEDYDEINRSLLLDIDHVRRDIKQKKNTYAWLLVACEEDEDCKERVVRAFLKHLFNI